MALSLGSTLPTVGSLRLDGDDIPFLAADLWLDTDDESWGLVLDVPLEVSVWWGEKEVEARTRDGRSLDGRARVQRLVKTNHHVRVVLRGVEPLRRR